MFKIKKIIYFIFLLSITSLSYSGNNEEKSIKLEGVENGKTYSSPIKLNFIIFLHQQVLSVKSFRQKKYATL